MVVAPLLPPTPRTRLIGRVSELTAARSLLLDETVPLLSLIGPAGVGKTRIALAVADELADAFADGVVWVDLAPLTDPELVTTAVASAIGLSLSPEHFIAEELAQALHSRQVLLLFDNCEHLLVPTAMLVAAILIACPAVQVLATSRAPLRVRGEHELIVNPLPVPSATGMVNASCLIENEAVCLFLERARAVRSTLPIDEPTIATVAAICRTLDGLPLALELAAARMRLLSAAALLTQLQDHLRLLGGSVRDLPARQQTMRSAIAWSHDLLALEDQATFRRLGIFVGGFDLDAVVAVANGASSVITEQLEALLDHSLIWWEDRSNGTVRFGMLETIREFAHSQLVESGEHDELAARHAAYFSSLIERAERAFWDVGTTEWLQMFDLVSEHANIRAALDWLAVHDPVGFVRLERLS